MLRRKKKSRHKQGSYRTPSAAVRFIEFAFLSLALSPHSALNETIMFLVIPYTRDKECEKELYENFIPDSDCSSGMTMCDVLLMQHCPNSCVSFINNIYLKKKNHSEYIVEKKDFRWSTSSWMKGIFECPNIYIYFRNQVLRIHILVVINTPNRKRVSLHKVIKLRSNKRKIECIYRICIKFMFDIVLVSLFFYNNICSSHGKSRCCNLISDLNE